MAGEDLLAPPFQETEGTFVVMLRSHGDIRLRRPRHVTWPPRRRTGR